MTFVRMGQKILDARVKFFQRAKGSQFILRKQLGHALVGGAPIPALPPVNDQRHRQSHSARHNPAHKRRHPLTRSSRSLRGHFQQKFVMHLQKQPGIQPLQLRIMQATAQ